MTELGTWAVSNGKYVLDNVVEVMREQWRAGKQIVVLVGAGISVQSGFPALSQLGMHLLTLDALREHKMRIPLYSADSSGRVDDENADVYSLLRDGWSSPFLFSELYGLDKTRTIRRYLEKRLGATDRLNRMQRVELKEFAGRSLGLNWFQLLDRVAENDPRMVEVLIDEVSSRVVPGAAHNLLSEFVSWFNVKLILTTNFDSLIEDSLRAEGQSPIVFDVHMSAPPPPRLVMEPHLSVVKLHGSRYGIRADRTIDTPLDFGHLHTIESYFEPDALLLILDYGGNDRRLMDLIKLLIERQSSGVSSANERKLIRVDGIATDKENPFFALGRANRDRVWNTYYPHSRLFLLDALQKCSGKLPNTWKGYPAVPQTPAPFQRNYMFGCEPYYDEDAKESLGSHAVEQPILRKQNDELSGKHFRVLFGEPGTGVSQRLAQVAEDCYKTHQILWCDVDEAASVGTLVSSLYSFAVSRQPELPNVPLPLNLPTFDVHDDTRPDDLDFDSLARTAEAIWNRIKRENYLIIIDSVSYGILQLLRLSRPKYQRDADPRLKRKAARLLLFIAILGWHANNDRVRSEEDSNDYQHTDCILLIGTHFCFTGKDINNREDANDNKDINEILEMCNAALRAIGKERPITSRGKNAASAKYDNVLLTSKRRSPSAQDIMPYIELIIKDKSSDGINVNRDELVGGLKTSYRFSPIADSKSSKTTLSMGAPSKKTRAPSVAKSTIAAETKHWGSRRNELEDADAAIEFIRSTEEEFIYQRKDDAEPYLPLGRFLFEAALCNRPRAWCQMLDLPVVETYSKTIAAEDEDNRFLALNRLVEMSLSWGFLRYQPGAFYYMDNTLRDKLRQQGKEWNDCYKRGEKLAAIENRVHEKMYRYYERAYNVSGDIVALNYFFYHADQIIRSYVEPKYDDAEYIKVINELARGLLENTTRSRKHLNVYDHVFLLLRLRDIIFEPLEKKTYLKDIILNIDAALREIYDDAEDFENGQQLRSHAPFKNKLREQQELHARNYDLSRSCLAGFCASPLNRSNSKAYEEVAKQPSGTKNLSLLQFTNEVIGLAANYETAVGTKPVVGSQKLSRNRPVEDSLLTSIRFARTVSRLGYYGGDEDPKRQVQCARAATTALKLGKRLLASFYDQHYFNSKYYWARFHNASAFTYLYQSNLNQFQINAFSKVYRATSMASSYAMRAGGVLGASQRAIAAVTSAEALIWEGRYIILRKSDDHKQANARQAAALQELTEAKTLLTESRLALAWWREITVLTCMAKNDLLRSCLNKICGSDGPVIDGDGSFRDLGANLDDLAVHARLLKGLAADVCFLRAVVWRDPWRQLRLSHQILRTTLYASWILSITIEKYNRNNSSVTRKEKNRLSEERKQLTSICADALSSLRLIGGIEKIFLRSPYTCTMS